MPELNRDAELGSVVTALQAITVANGFDRDVVQVWRVTPTRDTIKDDSLVLLPDIDTVIEEDININVREWLIVIVGYIKDRKKENEIEKFKGQVIKGLREQMPVAIDPIIYRSIGTIDPSGISREFDDASFGVSYNIRYFENIN